MLLRIKVFGSAAFQAFLNSLLKISQFAFLFQSVNVSSVAKEFQLTLRAFAKPGTFDRNASVNPNITQNRNLSNVLRNPGFANALLCAANFITPYGHNTLRTF